MFTINCKGKIISLENPLVMGIINATPDSFYRENKNSDLENGVATAERMIMEGADILDIGGQSTRPGSTRITSKEESDRVIPLISNIHKKFPEVIISVDTYYATVAIAAVNAGASIINDISAGNMDIDMIPAVAALNVPYICMHMKGTPETMHHDPSYDNVTNDVLRFFIEKTDQCKKAGIHDVIIDPGFGFGKTAEHNFTLLKNLSIFKMLGKPILAGLSRKGTIYNTLGVSPEEALNGTTVLNTLAIKNGAHILRVHDVKEAKEVVTLLKAYKKAVPVNGTASDTFY